MLGVVRDTFTVCVDRRLSHDELWARDHAALRRLLGQRNECATCKMFSREN